MGLKIRRSSFFRIFLFLVTNSVEQSTKLILGLDSLTGKAFSFKLKVVVRAFFFTQLNKIISEQFIFFPNLAHYMSLIQFTFLPFF